MMPPKTVQALQPCNGAENCRHPGGSLPFEFHKYYDQLEHGDTAEMSSSCIQAVLKISRECHKALRKFAIDELDAHKLADMTDWSSEDMINLILDVVESLRSRLDQFRKENIGNQMYRRLDESEHYIRQALTAEVIKIQTFRLSTRKRAQEKQEEVENARAMQRSVVEKQLSFIRNGKPQGEQDTTPRSPILDIGRLLGSSGFGTAAFDRTPRSPAVVDGENGTLSAMERDIDSISAKVRDVSIGQQEDEISGSAASRGSDVGKGFDLTDQNRYDVKGSEGPELEPQERDEKLRTLEEQLAELQHDNAELGFCLAVRQYVPPGNVKRLEFRLNLNKELTKATIDRLVLNPKFRIKFELDVMENFERHDVSTSG